MFSSWMVASFLIIGGTEQNSLVHTPFVQETRQFFLPGKQIPTTALEANESLVDFPTIAINSAGTITATAKSNLGKTYTISIRNEEGTLKQEVIQQQSAYYGLWTTPAGLLTVSQKELSRVPASEQADKEILYQPQRSAGRGAVDGVLLSFAVSPQGKIAVGTEQGLLFGQQDFDKQQGAWNFVPQYPADDRYSWAPRKVTAMTFDPTGTFWFGSDQGVGCLTDGKWQLYTGAEGLPYDHFTCAASGEPGVVWFGTERGAIRFDGKQWAYRASERWLPNDWVNSIAVDKQGNAWIATPKGISLIKRSEMTLEKKAAFFIDQVESRHNRDGYIADCLLTRKGDLTSATAKITDNDGGYTSMYGAAMAFRYAVTKDPQAKALAERSFQACKRLVDVVPEAMRGFPARVLIPIDWHESVNEQYGEQYNLGSQQDDPFWKLISPRFVKSEDGKYFWKCDTSSDELSAQYFFYAIYYDLVAETEGEKQPVRKVVGEITDHLIRNQYNLVDHDQHPTRWGRFGPDYLHTYQGWEQRGLNSLMILSFLATAKHVTGDTKYEEAARELREKYSYHINTLHPRPTFPPEMIAPWDNDLGLWSYYNLLNYEEDPELLILYRQSLEHFWLFMSLQKNPLWNLLYGAAAQMFAQKAPTQPSPAGGGLAATNAFQDTSQIFPDHPVYTKKQLKKLIPYDPHTEDNLDTLRELPLDLIAWEMKNSHRLDVQQDPTPGQEPAYGWSRATGKALPINERGHVRQDRDGFAIDMLEGGEGSGMTEHEGTFYLLPYYLGRFYGFIR